jgi:uncharacterized protein YjiS (DUF1127 family)
MNLLQKISLFLAQYRAFRASFVELKGYSDRELNELGLARCDITRVAYEEAERQTATLIPPRPRVEDRYPLAACHTWAPLPE